MLDELNASKKLCKEKDALLLDKERELEDARAAAAAAGASAACGRPKDVRAALVAVSGRRQRRACGWGRGAPRAEVVHLQHAAAEHPTVVRAIGLVHVRLARSV